MLPAVKCCGKVSYGPKHDVSGIKLCRDCKHFMSDRVHFERCRAFGELDVVSGRKIPMHAIIARMTPEYCGKEAKYFLAAAAVRSDESQVRQVGES